MGGPAAAVAGYRRATCGRWSGPFAAVALYGTSAIALTWPLATRLTTAVPWDLGDPLLNSWIVRLGRGSPVAVRLRRSARLRAGYWHANIFHPSPYALAYSEHLFPQALQALPVWALTRTRFSLQPPLLSTFVLSGLGTYVLVRELTGDARVALVSGLAFAFAPYRSAIPPTCRCCHPNGCRSRYTAPA